MAVMAWESRSATTTATDFPIIYVTQYGRNILYHNNGNGTFTDVTEKAGVAAPGGAPALSGSTTTTTGRLDLFVCQFAEFDAALGCGTDGDGRAPLLHSANLQAAAKLALSQQRRWNVHRRKPGTGIASIWARPGESSRQT